MIFSDFQWIIIIGWCTFSTAEMLPTFFRLLSGFVLTEPLPPSMHSFHDIFIAWLCSVFEKLLCKNLWLNYVQSTKIFLLVAACVFYRIAKHTQGQILWLSTFAIYNKQTCKLRRLEFFWPAQNFWLKFWKQWVIWHAQSYKQLKIWQLHKQFKKFAYDLMTNALFAIYTSKKGIILKFWELFVNSRTFFFYEFYIVSHFRLDAKQNCPYHRSKHKKEIFVKASNTKTKLSLLKCVEIEFKTKLWKLYVCKLSSLLNTLLYYCVFTFILKDTFVFLIKKNE